MPSTRAKRAPRALVAIFKKERRLATGSVFNSDVMDAELLQRKTWPVLVYYREGRGNGGQNTLLCLVHSAFEDGARSQPVAAAAELLGNLGHVDMRAGPK